MWKVTNDINNSKLSKFENEVIKPFFYEILNCKGLNYTIPFLDYLKDDTLLKDINNKNILNFISKRKKDKISFAAHVDVLINNNTLENLRHYYALYIYQNRQINQKYTSIYFEDIPIQFKKIFNEFFYGKIFDSVELWTILGEEPLKRKKFHENFKMENNINVCPYCDIDTTTNKGNNQVEHFWPKSKYPFLAMNAYNLISSCVSCNMPNEGKGTTNYQIITMPYVSQVGDKISFVLNPENKCVTVSTAQLEIDNYLKLLNLYNRYESGDVYRALMNRGNELYSTLLDMERYSKEEIKEKDIKEYVVNKKKYDKKMVPLYFASIDIFSDYDAYKKFCKIKKIITT